MKKTIVATVLMLIAITTMAQEKDTLVVGYNIVPPFVEENNGELDGPSVWLWNRIAEENNLVFRYENHNLDELIEGLSKGTIDLSLSPLTITSKRSDRIDFTAPYYIAYSTVLEKVESPRSTVIAFIRSFFSATFFKSLGTLALVIFIFGFVVWLLERRANPEEFGKGWRGIWSGFWWSAVTMTTVGYGDKSPRTAGGRIIALIWMFTAIIIISGLTASIASSLTVSTLATANNELEDYKEKKLGTVSESGTEKWLNRNFFTNTRSYADLDKAKEALDNGDVAAIAYDRPILRSLIRDEPADKYEILPIEYNAQFYAMGVNRNLTEDLKHRINIEMLEAIETMQWKVLLAEYNLKLE